MAKSKAPLEFEFDVLVSRENFCDRKKELSEIAKLVDKDQRIILYAPRRYGKTSMIKNLICEDFVTSSRNHIFFYFNFMDVDSIDSITERLYSGINNGILRFFKTRALLEAVLDYFKGPAVSFSVDPLTNSPIFEFKGGTSKSQKKISDLFKGLSRLLKDKNALFVFDEFQDISLVSEAAALLRTELQEMNKQSVIILGSKRALLSEMFASNKSPFFNYGLEMHLDPISVDEWLPYFNTRLEQRNMNITRDALSMLCEFMCDVPNAICEVGFWLHHYADVKTIEEESLVKFLDELVSKKEHSLRYQLSGMSAPEKSVISALARAKYVKKISSKEFQSVVKPVASATKKIIDRLLKRGFIEWEQDKGYRLSDPLLRYFLLRNPS